MSQATPVPPQSLTFLVRHTRLQMAQARLTLISRRPRAKVALGLASVVVGVHTAFVLGALSPMLQHHGLAAVLRVYWAELTLLATVVAAGLTLLVTVLSSAQDALTRAELEGGVLLHLGPDGLAATVRGATLYYDWEHVSVERSQLGLLFVLPRGAFHLLPHEAISRRQWSALAALLDRAAQRVRLAAGASEREECLADRRCLEAYSTE